MFIFCIYQLRDELNDAIGFSRIIELLSESKKPIVGHNALLDFVYIFNQFYQPLPNTLNEFKTQLLQLFPRIYDTKYIVLSSALGTQLQSTSLSALFEYMQAKVKPSPNSLLCTDSRFDQYRQALSEDGDEIIMPCHEAGFDAFMTSICFLGLISHDKNGQVLEPLWPIDTSVNTISKDKFETRLSQLDSFQNKMNLMLSDGMLIDLTNLDQTIDRSRVFRISSTKRKLNSVNIDHYFRPKKILKMIKENEKEAFVFLSKEEEEEEEEEQEQEQEEKEEVNTQDKQKSDLNIVPYDKYIASSSSSSSSSSAGGNTTGSTCSSTTYGLLLNEQEKTKTSASRKHEPLPEMKKSDGKSCVIS
jgi:poly(A)-specific ribonuclease